MAKIPLDVEHERREDAPMNTTNKPLTCKRVAPGLYTCEGFTIERVDASSHYGASWMLTWPDEPCADAAFDTKAEAVAQIAREIA